MNTEVSELEQIIVSLSMAIFKKQYKIAQEKMCICQRYRDKCLLRAWQDKHRMTLSELVKDWERASNGTIFPSWTLSAQWFASGILNPPLWPPDGCASGRGKQWAPPTLALELNRGLISYLEMLPWVLSITGFILPSAQDSRFLQPSCSPKVGGCWSTENLYQVDGSFCHNETEHIEHLF